ncbi:uncharacterized mitochondrial protein AtMg00810-like [Nicotiana tomentosiformis]|uniref:uncharacterized mitochondrial protein AtMg00810-like n=1 Tax=Nicotiana tomentosiformis TaxID=4098 RepID=UPI00388C8FD9
MSREFKMTDVGHMSCYLGLEVKQIEDEIFISQESYTKEILKKFNMLDCNPVNTPMESRTKLSKFNEGEKVDPIFFKRLVGSLRYLTCTSSDILFTVGVVSRFIEAPTSTHLKVTRRILRYLKVEIFDGSGHFRMWQVEVLDVLFQQRLDIAIEEKKPDNIIE